MYYFPLIFFIKKFEINHLKMSFIVCKKLENFILPTNSFLAPVTARPLQQSVFPYLTKKYFKNMK
jgi:hypothetical protein